MFILDEFQVYVELECMLVPEYVLWVESRRFRTLAVRLF